jgi:opacity protein-like surface antigen
MNEMRAKLFTAAAAVAIATPALAADLYTPQYVPPISDPVYKPTPMVVGHLMLGVGFISLDDFSGPFSDDSLGVFVGAGRANINLGGSLNFQLETGGFALFNDGSSYSSIGVAGHLWTKLNSAAVGVYGGVNWPTGGSIYTLGLEGEVYLGNFTLGGDIDYNWTDPGGGDYWSTSVWADAYLNPNWRLGGEFEYYSNGGDIWTAAVDTEYRFGGPISGWAKVAYADGSGGGDGIWSGLLGVRVFMDGGDTLIGHDRNVPWESGLLGPDQGGP